MKRIIKFRAWVVDKKMITDFHSIELYHNGKHHVNTTPTSHYDETSILMQFTGLTDKNGVEIYEGDVLERWGNKYTVIWDNLGFRMKWVEEDSVWRFPDELCEVIGNIHQNHELL